MSRFDAMKKIPVYGIIEFSEKENESYFYSNNLRSHLDSHQFVNSPHKHSTYITILFTEGRGEHLIDFDVYPVKPGSVFLLNPGQVHSWKLSSDVKGFVFLHTREFYDSIFVNRKIEDFPFFFIRKNYPVIYLSSKDGKRIEDLFETINEEFRKDSGYRLLKLGSLTDLLYIELAELYRTKEKPAKDISPNYLKVKKLQKLIDENYKTEKSPSEYANLMNMSIRHLNRICQETLNKTTGDLIFERIILEAKRMLIHKDVSVSLVADELGYEDVSYFIRLFKSKTGESPKEFQLNMGKPF